MGLVGKSGWITPIAVHQPSTSRIYCCYCNIDESLEASTNLYFCVWCTTWHDISRSATSQNEENYHNGWLLRGRFSWVIVKTLIHDNSISDVADNQLDPRGHQLLPMMEMIKMIEMLNGFIAVTLV